MKLSFLPKEKKEELLDDAAILKRYWLADLMTSRPTFEVSQVALHNGLLKE